VRRTVGGCGAISSPIDSSHRSSERRRRWRGREWGSGCHWSRRGHGGFLGTGGTSWRSRRRDLAQ
jgi:hypothetical protein